MQETKRPQRDQTDHKETQNRLASHNMTTKKHKTSTKRCKMTANHFSESVLFLWEFCFTLSHNPSGCLFIAYSDWSVITKNAAALTRRTTIDSTEEGDLL